MAERGAATGDDDGEHGGTPATPFDALGVIGSQEVAIADGLRHLELYTMSGLLTLLWHEPSAAEHGLDDARDARFLERAVDVLADPWKSGKIRVDDLLRGLRRDADILRQGEGGLPVQQRVVDDLRAAAQLVRIEPARRSEHAFGGAVVNVEARLKRFRKRGVTGQVREHSKLDLRVVG